MPVIPLSYPLDLTATAATNFIQNEVVTFNTAQEKMFVPSKGPFYTLSMEIRHGVTNALLQPETQYKLLQPVKEAIRMSGKEVCAVIYITDNSVPSITISYRVIGGVFSDTASEIGDILLNNPLPPSGQVSWWDILDKPDQFTPSEHLHHVDNIYGMSDVVAVLENIRIAILAGDSVAIGAIYQYINNLLTNLDYATYNQVLTLFNSIERPPIKVYKTYADLRAETNVINDAALVYLTLGKDSPNDGKGRAFYWDVDSAIDDDDDITVKPSIITGLDTGRFVRVLAETDIPPATVPPIKVYNTYADLRAETNVINDAALVYLTLGKNTPNDGKGRAFYWNATSIRTDDNNTTIKPTFIDELDPGRYVSILAVEQDLITSTIETRSRMRVHGIDSVLETNALYQGDIDEAVLSGDYWINDSVINAPFTNAKLIVRPSAGTLSTPSVVMQELKNEYKTANRKGTLVYTSYIWTPWIYTSMDVNPDLGIVIRHVADVPVLLPCYIGEDPNKTTVTVYISGKIQYINIYDIIPLYTSGTDTGLFYIYLVEVSLGAFRLFRYSVAPEYGDSINKRGNMYYPGESPKTSNKLFVGMIFEYDGLLTVCRSWFKDPGFIEHYPNYNFTVADQQFGNYEIGKISGKSKQLILEEEVFTYGINAYESSAFTFVGGEGLPRVPILVWANETVHLDFNISYSLDAPANSLGVITFKNIVYNLGTVSPGISSVALENRITNGPHTGGLVADASHVNPPTGHWDTLTTGYKYVSSQDSVLVTAIYGRARINSSGGKLTLLPSTPVITTPTRCTVTLDEVHYFRNLNIKSVAAATVLGSNFTVQLYGDIFDLDLIDRYVDVYGALPPEDSEVVFVVNPGCFICASSTANYAVVNRAAWPAGCTVKLSVRTGGAICGRGGNGGKGQSLKQTRNDTLSAQWGEEIGNSSYPIMTDTAENGSPGGSAIYSETSIFIDNKGLISVGSGGGGGGWVQIPHLMEFWQTGWFIYKAHELGEYWNVFYGIMTNMAAGSGGGGGWPYGSGGASGVLEYYPLTPHTPIVNADIGLPAWELPSNAPFTGVNGTPASKYIAGTGGARPRALRSEVNLGIDPSYTGPQSLTIIDPNTSYPYGWTILPWEYSGEPGSDGSLYLDGYAGAGGNGGDIRSNLPAGFNGYRPPNTDPVPTLSGGAPGTYAIHLTAGKVLYLSPPGTIYGAVVAPDGIEVL